jgi:HSP20 family protein
MLAARCAGGYADLLIAIPSHCTHARGGRVSHYFRRRTMSLIRWDPFGEVDTMFNRMLGSQFWPRLTLEGNGGKKLQWAPSADISETDKEYLIRAELPAVNKEDVEVTLDNGVITIKGERKQQQEDKNEKFHRVETIYGSFERSFSLPDNVNAEAIRCESKDGVLSVHIPKSEVPKQKPKQIAVQ